jgi:lysosomal Pro-X carboxypeptidase
LDIRDTSVFQIINYAQTYGLYWKVAIFDVFLGALVVALEHRFYGESQPFDNLSNDNLRYLTSEQAYDADLLRLTIYSLADLAVFIQWVKSQTDDADNSPVVTFGCSYSGALAAWFRMKYPTVTIGSIASSAPVQAVLVFIYTVLK